MVARRVSACKVEVDSIMLLLPGLLLVGCAGELTIACPQLDRWRQNLTRCTGRLQCRKRAFLQNIVRKGWREQWLSMGASASGACLRGTACMLAGCGRRCRRRPGWRASPLEAICSGISPRLPLRSSGGTMASVLLKRHVARHASGADFACTVRRRPVSPTSSRAVSAISAPPSPRTAGEGTGEQYGISAAAGVLGWAKRPSALGRGDQVCAAVERRVRRRWERPACQRLTVSDGGEAASSDGTATSAETSKSSRSSNRWSGSRCGGPLYDWIGRLRGASAVRRRQWRQQQQQQQWRLVVGGLAAEEYGWTLPAAHGTTRRQHQRAAGAYGRQGWRIAFDHPPTKRDGSMRPSGEPRRGLQSSSKDSFVRRRKWLCLTRP